VTLGAQDFFARCTGLPVWIRLLDGGRRVAAATIRPGVMYGSPFFSDPVQVEETVAAISSAVAALYGRLHGRTPSVVTTVCHDDVVVCVLGGVFTTAERTLVATGGLEVVQAERFARRDAVEPPLRALIETVTGRPIQACLGEIGAEGLAFETFPLDPD
jgi:uncharacterized protein YbcI